jgi:acetyl esterase/lipase
MDDVVIQNVAYRAVNGTSLTMDIYYPPNMTGDARLPVVIFAYGIPDSVAIELVGTGLKDYGQYTSSGRLVAASGLAAIAYETQQPHVDIEHLVTFVRENAASLNLDADRIGVWTSSANGPTTMSYIQQESREFIKCAVFYTAFMPTPDGKYSPQIDAICEQTGCISAPLQGIERLRTDLPLFAVQGGQDSVPLVSDTMAHFASVAAGSGVPLTYIEYADGRHAWFLDQDTERSRELIVQTLEFLKAHLLEE